ncbi:hypothetical protein CYMTET_20573 [Cymbomonas tetramitiformis]|uniref:Apple domain-containing protein n=1 Tax=Cymbomonas tetramitiformis TaxID=36881 RepID=A0AAE0G3S7_9CHLO|nr:hypothetical protein CYMTET_20573 [Cymbomonas tetramitiformis]
MKSYIAILSCAVLFVGSVQGLAETCKFMEYNDVYYSGDSVTISDSKYNVKSESITSDTCKNICLDTLGCRGFTWRQTDDGDSEKCVFKTFTGPIDESNLVEKEGSVFFSLQQSDKGHLCYVDLCTYKAMSGKNVHDHALHLHGSMQNIAGSPSYCEAVCKGLKGCRGFEWKPMEQTCRFKRFSAEKAQNKVENVGEGNSDDRTFYLREQSGPGEKCEVDNFVSEGSKDEGKNSASASGFSISTFGVFATIGSIGAVAVISVFVYRKRASAQVSSGDYVSMEYGEDEI